jgi:hypothetical protein
MLFHILLQAKVRKVDEIYAGFIYILNPYRGKRFGFKNNSERMTYSKCDGGEGV